MKRHGKSFSTSLAVYHDKMWRHVIKHLRQTAKYNGEDTVHKTRVAVKKLMALYDLIAYDGKNIRPLLKIYKLLGKLRDHTNALSLCLEFKIDSAILDGQGRKSIKTGKRVQEKIQRQHDKWKHIKKDSIKHLSHIDVAVWEKYLKKGMSQIHTSLASSPTYEELHGIRKRIKNILYNNEIYSGHTAAGLDKDDVKYLKDLEEQISEWHDLLYLKGNF